jgi:hypothetical protein
VNKHIYFKNSIYIKMDHAPYHLEVLDTNYCNNRLLEIFSRAHMSYINQIFGDETIRSIIQSVYKKSGKLVVLPSGPNFENSVHHVYYYNSDEEVEVPVFNSNNSGNQAKDPSEARHNGGASPNQPKNALKSNNNVVKNVLGNLVNQVEAKVTDNEEEENFWTEYSSKVCSVDNGYQNIAIDVNDTLCQSYSLMALLDIDFDTTPSRNATKEQKYKKHLAMINMYRKILSNKGFLREFNKIIRDEDNSRLWQDSVDDTHVFYIIEKYKKPAIITSNIKHVLDIWEKWGWQYFVGDGKCEKLKQDGGGKRKTRRRSPVS